MHILHVTHGYKPASRLGGPIASVSAIAERMAARGHKVTVFATNSNFDRNLDVLVDQPTMVDGVEVWYFRQQDPIKTYLPWLTYFSRSIGYLYAPAMRKALQRKLPDVDIVHTHMPYIYPTWLAGRHALAAGKPLFYNQRGAYNPMLLDYRRWKKLAYIELVEKPMMRRASGLIALAQHEVDNYRALGVTTPCHVVPNGIEVCNFRRTARSGALSDLGIDDSQQVVLFFGRLHPTKSVDLLLEAFKRIADRHPDAVLVLAGPDEGNLTGELAAASRHLAHRVMIPGVVSGERKLDLLARADLFVLPSMGEGLSMAVLEALASHTAVILSSECNFPVVEEAGAGWVVERNVERIAEAMSRALSDRATLAAAGERAYQLVRDRFSWEPIVERLEAIYRDALAPR